jgi:hypothetical protein
MSDALAIRFEREGHVKYIVKAVVVLGLSAFFGELFIAPQIAKLNLTMLGSWGGLVLTALVVTTGVHGVAKFLWGEADSVGESSVHAVFDVLAGRFDLAQTMLLHLVSVAAASTFLLGYVNAAESAALQRKSEVANERSVIFRAGWVSRAESWSGREAESAYRRVRALG